MSKYRSIDLFASIGNIHWGFDNVFGRDIEIVFVSGWDKYYEKLKRLGQVVKLPSNFAEFMFVDNVG